MEIFQEEHRRPPTREGFDVPAKEYLGTAADLLCVVADVLQPGARAEIDADQVANDGSGLFAFRSHHVSEHPHELCPGDAQGIVVAYVAVGCHYIA